MSTTTLTSEFSPIWLIIDDASGAPVAVGHGQSEATAIAMTATIVDGGVEHRGPDGGLVYRETRSIEVDRGTATAPRTALSHDRRTFEVDVETSAPDAWRLTWRYEFGGAAAPLAINVRVHALSPESTLRNVHLDTVVGTTMDGWRVHAPGNAIRCNLERSDFVKRQLVLPMAGVDGSCGLVAFEHTVDRPRTLVLWPASKTEIGDTYLVPAPDGRTELTWKTDLAGRPGMGGVLATAPMLIDHLDARFEDVVASLPERLAAIGVVSPNDPPEWARAANIYEVQVGYGVFAGGWTYSPYPTAQDLLDDLGRIHSLGYDTLQLMPRQPYPSYNVHDYADITTSYGDEAVISELVRQAHSRGMRVILDILLHGVVDQTVVAEAIETIEHGPFADQLDGPFPDITTLDTDEVDAILITWSRHVLDFGPHWIAGSPVEHPLIAEHPEWFCRDSSGAITSRYSRAFDLSHPGWQRYLIDSCLDLVRRLDIDGFRLDAPSYNNFHNWSHRTQSNAAVSMLAALPLFDQLREELRALKPDSLLYTEPSGILWRVAMDLNYNYDELFIIRALLRPGSGSPHWPRTARELTEWIALRDATLPPGSMTAHCIDSHDSFWWPSPGAKWRREQYGIEATQAMLALFALSGEPYMTFVGGEVGMEHTVTAINLLRQSHREFGVGRSDHRSVHVDHDQVYGVLRHGQEGTGLVLVNVADAPAQVNVTLSCHEQGQLLHNVTNEALVGGPSITWEQTDNGDARAMLTLPAFGFAAFRVASANQLHLAWRPHT